MGTAKNKRSNLTSDREKWNVIFNAFKLLLRKQQSQLDSLVEECNLLQQRFKILHDRRMSDVVLLEDQISQMRRQLALVELAKLVEATKADLLKGSDQREALVYKHKLEHAESELQDFKAWFDILSHRCPDPECISPNKVYESLKAMDGGRNISSKGVSSNHCKTLEKEVATLKREYGKLSVKSSSDKSALQTEMNFVWNQYKTMESDYTIQLRAKSEEVDKANEKLRGLLETLEHLQSSNTEKDDKLETLRIKIAKLEAETNEKDEEISRVRKELESLKSVSKTAAATPLLKRCSGDPSSSRSRSTRNGGTKGDVASSVHEQGGKQSKRKRSDTITEATPKLFTSQFKIPKLKIKSPSG